jgi:hypothetical protein
VEEKNNRTE